MPQDPPRSAQPAIPESLRKQLDGFRRDLWRAKIVEAVLAGLCGLFASFLLVFALDRFFPTPAWVRLLILLAGTSLFAGFAPYWVHRWVWGHRRETQLARLIARRYPGLGDRLLGVVELQEQEEQADTLSPRLRAAAMEAVAADAARRELRSALPASAQRKLTIASLAAVAIAVAALTLVPKAGINSLKRWALPLSETPRYTFTRLDRVPSELHVPQGEAFELDLQLAADSEWQPAEAVARIGRQDPVHTALAGRRYHLTFPAQQDPQILQLKVGDASHQLRILPTLRPSVEKSFATLEFPAYLDLSPRRIDLTSGNLPAVTGSKVTLSLRSTRNLSSASFGPIVFDQADPKIPVPDPGFPLEGELDIAGPEATTPSFTVGSRPFIIPLRWSDHLGLSGSQDFRLRVDAVADQAPNAYLSGIERNKVILPEETVDLELLAEDDFGLKEIGLEWQGEFTRASSDAPAKGELRLLKGEPGMARMADKAAFSPATYQIPPQKLTLRAYTEDHLPGRGRVYSQPLTLYVLTHDEHAQMLKSKFDRTIGELEDLARKERNLHEENQRLERLSPEDLQKPENQERLQRQQDAENQQKEDMEDLAKELEELFKDSARNGTIDKDTLRKMAEALKSMQELSQQDLPKVEEKLRDSHDQRNTPEKSAEDLKKAVEEQKKALEKMQDAVEKATDANNRFEAGTFVNRLKKAASDQNSVAEALIARFNQTLGVTPEELDPADSGKLEDTIRQQSNTSSDVRWIQEDLGHFFARSNLPAYREILDEMVASRIDIGLEEIRTRIQTNHGFIASSDAKKWSKQLQDWAAKLEGLAKKDDPNGGGGEGGGGDNPDEDFEFMLRVMKMIQQEQDLRARTRAAETRRRALTAAEAKP